jgi:hypothetical protein
VVVCCLRGRDSPTDIPSEDMIVWVEESTSEWSGCYLTISRLVGGVVSAETSAAALGSLEVLDGRLAHSLSLALIVRRGSQVPNPLWRDTSQLDVEAEALPAR